MKISEFGWGLRPHAPAKGRALWKPICFLLLRVAQQQKQGILKGQAPLTGVWGQRPQ